MALARHWLWTIPHSASLSALLSLSLKATTSYSSQSTHSFIHPIYCPSEAGSCYLKVLACIYPIHLSLPQTLSSLLLVNTQRHTVYQHERQQEAPHIFRVLRTSCDPPTNPIIKTWAAHHRCALAQPSFHLWIKPCWIFPAWRRLDLTQRASEQSNYWFDQKHICLRRNYDWFWFTVPHVRFPQHMEPNSENKENECGQWGSFVPLQ